MAWKTKKSAYTPTKSAAELNAELAEKVKALTDKLESV
jgi:hypothetical protein